ncbi:LmeA family phospholipid-binding protein [Mycolicibacterium phlei]
MTQPPQRPGPPDWRGRGTPPPNQGPRRPPPRREPPPRQQRPPQPPPEPRTERVPRPDARTERVPRPDARTEKLRGQPPVAGPTQRIPRPPSPADVRPTQQLYRHQPPPPPPPKFGPTPGSSGKPRRRRARTMTILATVLIVVALLAGGLAVGELYARNRADGVLTEVAECVTEDGVTISFGVNPPFLWQHLTGHYTNISVTSDGNRVQSADGMTAEVTLEDVRLEGTGDAKGTIGSLQATLSWKSAGIKDTIAENLPGVGSLITGVRTDPAAGTVILEASGDNSVTAKPVVENGDLNLQVLDVVGPLPKDAVQGALNELTKKLNDNYPLGIHADSVEVTDTGVVGKFSSQDAKIPKEDADPCFARL